MEKETYSKGIQAELNNRKSQTGFETFGEMFQQYYSSPESYLQGLKYHMKEHMTLGETSAALHAFYAQPFRISAPPPPAKISHSHHSVDPNSQKNCPPNKPLLSKDVDSDSQSLESINSGTLSSSSSSSHPLHKPNYECFYCDPARLNTPQQNKKPKVERMLPCDKCDYFTALTSSLKSHMLKHTDDKPLKCQYCDYSTKHMSALKLHLSKHTGILQYSCGQCSYRTASSSSLKSHMLKHTDVKHLKCPFCDYSTKHKNALKMHMCKHNGILEHACPECDYRTASSSCLKSHMLKHSDLRPEKCAYCEYSTKHKSALKNHLKKHATLPFCHVII